MRPKSLILLSLALGCGLVAALGINQMMAKQGPSTSGETVQVYVAAKDVNTNDLLQPESVKLEAWPKDKVPLGALSKDQDIEGRRARTKLYAGEPILDAKLLAKGEAGGSVIDNIPSGMRVVAIRVDAVKAGANLIKPGDRVDVIVHIQQNSTRGVTEPTTKTFLQDVRVFAVNDVFVRDHDGQQKITAQTISLLVKPEQVELITLAEEMGKIRLSMRGANDDTIAPSEGATADELVRGGANRGQRDHESQPEQVVDAGNPLMNILNQLKTAQQGGAQPEKAAHKMTIICGPDVQEYEIDPNRGVARMKAKGTPDDETPATDVLDVPVEATSEGQIDKT
jgi:pilus assembly protein CpaB